MKKLLFLFIIVAMVFTFPLVSNATCTKYGQVVRVTAYADGYGTYHYIYMKTSALSSVYFYARTSDDEMAEMATQALTNTIRVAIQGTAATCPSSGWLGTLRYIVLNP
jgi:hypothetical protein